MVWYVDGVVWYGMKVFDIFYEFVWCGFDEVVGIWCEFGIVV